jgi:ABC-type Zn2+ transport system substrate-binding protein/surface adhesin
VDGLAGVGDDPVRREIEQSSAGPTEAMLEQRRVGSMAPAEVMDEQVRNRQDRNDEPEDERHHEERQEHDDGEDRQRRAHQESEEYHGRHLDGAEAASDGEARDLLDLLGA